MIRKYKAEPTPQAFADAIGSEALSLVLGNAQSQVPVWLPAAIGWASIFSAVVVCDAWALRKAYTTLSAGLWTLQRHRGARMVIAAAWTGLSWHLLFGEKRILPPKQRALYERTHPLYVLRTWMINRNS